MVFTGNINVYWKSFVSSRDEISELTDTVSQILRLWTLSVFLSSSRNRPVYFSKHSVSETWFYLRLQVKPTYLDPNDRVSPYLRICIRGRPQNMLEWSEGLANWSQHHIQEIQGISRHFSDRPSDQSTQLGHLSHLDPRYHSRSQETTTPSSVVWVGKLFFLCWYRKEYSFSPSMISVEILLWCKASYLWSFNNLMFSYLSQMFFAVFDLWTPSWSSHRCPEIGTSSIDLAQLSRFYLKTETESRLRNVVFWKINRTVFR
jgi:hypothetical protein